jgi:hypothetical protein
MEEHKAGNSLDFLSIPTDEVMRIEKERARRRRYEQKTKRKKLGPNGRKNACPNSERPFVMWDGEGPQDAGYALFGSSAGDYICHPYLETEECLNLILDREEAQPDAIHIWFGCNYDVSMILRQLPWKCLNALKLFNSTVWGDYEIAHIPHKWMEIKSRGLIAKVFDIQQFFGTSYVNALLAMKVGTDDDIKYLTSEKARRSEFLYSEIKEIADYWRTELRLGVVLANKLRDTFLASGFDVRSWHGPGSLANLAMKRHGVFDAMAKTPPDVRAAARFAFAGGRFEMPRGGYIQGRIYNADIHSAYPHFARMLPNLAKGKWRRGRAYETDKFAVYYIRYRSRDRSPLTVHPLFQRLSTGEVVWPGTCEGWYWGPEAALVADTDEAEFLDAWIFDEEDEMDRPFAWLEEYYIRRKKLARMGSPLEFTFKLIINAVYGQLAQRAGWDRKTRTGPRSHQLEWAGYITSACRSAVYKAARSVGDKLISIDTDGLYATAPFDALDIGPDLGQWETEEFDSGIFWQSGIYSLRIDLGYDPSLGYGWVKGKTRGIPKGQYTADDLIHALNSNEPLKLKKKTFVGYGLALNGQNRDARLNTWEVSDHEIVFGGQGKRYHNAVHWCGKAGCKNGYHEFIPRPFRFSPADTTASRPHFLPWLENDALAESRKNIISDETLYDVNHLDEDEEWVRDYG